MKIEMRMADARRLAKGLYAGDSLPISQVKAGDEPLNVDWWRMNVQPESSESERHRAALTLYLHMAGSSKIPLPSETFPAVFDLDDGQMRPDKAVIKVFLDEGLIQPRMMVAQLVFDLTQAGRNYADRAE
ncbi:hypothetical protein JI749_10180 [Devosia oryziradicis]|uniref:Uncharacterized protein n=1 Tax=Devosia oryziradicis TaxID=2801335 RepID=A0ABX7BUM4_9HYPH|nr:hypothetical protein [Devosia oryziradicis]QQR34754.1 hypothetical protein JI749_10180 [Devosia oryziradicis]